MYNWIEINKNSLRHNFQLFNDLCLPHSVFAPVIKSNAYGHGLDLVFAELNELNPAWLCVNYVEEALQLRTLGYLNRIMVVGPTKGEDFALLAHNNIDAFLNSPVHLNAWLTLKNKPKIHLKFDTGMSRQGFACENAPDLAQKLKPFAPLLAGVCSHFANVEDVLEHEYAYEQLELFSQVRDVFSVSAYQPLFHISSSASTLLLQESRFDLCRVGISLYGLWPSKATRLSYLQINKELFPLKPVLSWYTQISQIKEVMAGKYIGYGCTYRALRSLKVAVLPIGYFEGYARLAGEHGAYVLVQGQRCPLVGRICMNMMVIDVSHLDNVSAGEKVTLIGKDGKEEIGAADFSAWAQTINYEGLTRLNPMIPRRVI